MVQLLLLIDQGYEYGDGMISANVRESAMVMRAELDGQRLRVSLRWLNGGYRAIRVVDERNPWWYRVLCADYPSKRHWLRARRYPWTKKFDTKIDRRCVLRALRDIENGRAETLYAQRVLPYVESYDRLVRTRGG